MRLGSEIVCLRPSSNLSVSIRSSITPQLLCVISLLEMKPLRNASAGAVLRLDLLSVFPIIAWSLVGSFVKLRSLRRR